MFSWITGPRITNAIEDLQPEANYESTFIDTPETPAHHFAVNSFKQALFGTPGPEANNNGSGQPERKGENVQPTQLSTTREDGPLLSPRKQLGGILVTPGAGNRGRKNVSFGNQVVDNEGKRGNMNRSGVSKDCPGRFPSPRTQKSQPFLGMPNENKPRTKLTAALHDSRTITQPSSDQRFKGKDDSDITMDLGAPRSESGKYWKEQYERYAKRSENELKRIIARQQLVKNFAMRRDGEVNKLAAKLEQERKRFRQREGELETQKKEYQEQLRQAMAENMSSGIEVAALKVHIANLEKGAAVTQSNDQQREPPFRIYNDSDEEPVDDQLEDNEEVEASIIQACSLVSSGKENSSPRIQSTTGITLSDSTNKVGDLPVTGSYEGRISAVPGKGVHTSVQNPGAALGITLEPAPASLLSKKSLKFPLNTCKPGLVNAKPTPKSVANMIPSSPLPMPSPDPWLGVDGCNLSQMDRRLMSTNSCQPHTGPGWDRPPRRHCTADPGSATKPPNTIENLDFGAEKISLIAFKTEPHLGENIDDESRVQIKSTRPIPEVDKGTNLDPRAEALRKLESNARQVSVDHKFRLSNISNISSHHAKGSAQVKCDRVELPLIDRKEQARRRLEERRLLRKK